MQQRSLARMLKFAYKNFYLFIALLSIIWSLSNSGQNHISNKTEYVFAEPDSLLDTKSLNEVKLRNLKKYRLHTNSKKRQSGTGTAFYIGSGMWLTARHVINKCQKVLIKEKSNQYLVEKIVIHPNSDLAIFWYSTTNKPNKFSISTNVSPSSFVSGFPGGNPGDAVLSLAGFMAMEQRRYNILEKHSIFAVIERHPQYLDSFGGISGGPSFDSSGNLNGVVVAEFVRRGLLASVSTKQISWLIAATKKGTYFPKYFESVHERNLMVSVNPDSFQSIGKKLRKEGTISQLFCIA